MQLGQLALLGTILSILVTRQAVSMIEPIEIDLFLGNIVENVNRHIIGALFGQASLL